jgi:hypothetical protein
MFQNVLLHLMRVAATKQTTFTISLKRSAPAFAAGHASRPNTPSRPSKVNLVEFQPLRCVDCVSGHRGLQMTIYEIPVLFEGTRGSR